MARREIYPLFTDMKYYGVHGVRASPLLLGFNVTRADRMKC